MGVNSLPKTVVKISGRIYDIGYAMRAHEQKDTD